MTLVYIFSFLFCVFMLFYILFSSWQTPRFRLRLWLKGTSSWRLSWLTWRGDTTRRWGVNTADTSALCFHSWWESKSLTSLQFKAIISEEREWREELDRDLKVLRKEYENKNNKVCLCFRTIISGYFETITIEWVLNEWIYIIFPSSAERNPKRGRMENLWRRFSTGRGRGNPWRRFIKIYIK